MQAAGVVVVVVAAAVAPAMAAAVDFLLGSVEHPNSSLLLFAVAVWGWIAVDFASQYF